MVTNLADLKSQFNSEHEAADNLDALERLRVSYLGKSGVITAQMKQIGGLSPDERKNFGANVNELKNYISDILTSSKEKLEAAALQQRLESEYIDVTLPSRDKMLQGTTHPITKVIWELTDILGSLGFEIAEGPQIEDDFHNFTALNIPAHHPAREMQDTFYFGENDGELPYVLRTHTSSVQIRTMEKRGAPIKIIAPGRTYRCDSDITHSPMFHQIEGLYIAENVTMADLKSCLMQIMQRFFLVDNVKTRFRPSFFPFTEPSAEMDIGCTRKEGELVIGEGNDWLEILGCGMVHPNVLEAVNIDSTKYQGFAFGIGIERLAMLKYGMSDLRQFFQSDARWLEHYGFTS